MLVGVSISLSPSDRARLVEIAADRNSPQKHVWRAQIVLLSADGVGTHGIMRATGTSKTCVWRWQQRIMEAGTNGLLIDKTRPSRVPPLGEAVTERLVALTLTAHKVKSRIGQRLPSPELARSESVRASYLAQPWPVAPSNRQFKLSNDPQFATKVRDIVGLYVNPPAHAVVLSVDEKSQIQALDLTQPGLPLKKGRCGTMSSGPLGLMTHDDKRNGTTTLFAAFNVLEDNVIGRCMQRPTHQEFISFVNAIKNQIPASKQGHVVLDNYATHKHPKVIEWLGRHDRFTFHFTPTSASRLNAAEGFFAKLTNQRLKRGVFHSIVALHAALNRFVI